jgi:hypothetical protein
MPARTKSVEQSIRDTDEPSTIAACLLLMLNRGA